jgi:class 3 adenylate cyclase
LLALVCAALHCVGPSVRLSAVLRTIAMRHVTPRAQVLLSDAALELLRSGRVRLHARVHEARPCPIHCAGG